MALNRWRRCPGSRSHKSVIIVAKLSFSGFVCLRLGREESGSWIGTKSHSQSRFPPLVVEICYTFWDFLTHYHDKTIFQSHWSSSSTSYQRFVLRRATRSVSNQVKGFQALNRLLRILDFCQIDKIWRTTSSFPLSSFSFFPFSVPWGDLRRWQLCPLLQLLQVHHWDNPLL